MANPAARQERLKFAHDDAQLALLEAEAIAKPSFQERVQKVAGDGDGNGALIEKQPDSRTGSQQLTSSEDTFAFLNVAEEIVEPPINLKLWAAQLARNTRLNRGIRTIARNTVGIGFDIVPIVAFNDDTTEEEKKRVLGEADRVRVFFKSLNPDQPFETLMECVVMDEEATGNGYLEFTRTGAGELEKAFHIPSVTVRILRHDRGFVQIRGGRRRFFKRFGEDKVMDARNGKFQDEEGFGKGDTTTVPGSMPIEGDPATQQDDRTPLAEEHRATEILHFRLYHPMSDTYGLPRFISAASAITGNWLSAKRNVVFFKNDAVPRMAILVTGGKLDPKSRDDLSSYLQEGQGEEEAHRILILQTTEEGIGLDGKSSTKLDLKPMTVGVTEDGSFLNYRTANDEEIREALGLSEVFFKSIKLTKASAVVAKQTTDEQEFEPARKQKEHLMNMRIVNGPQGLGVQEVMLRFQRPDTSDPLEKARVHEIYSKIGAITPNEIRRQLGQDPHPPEQEWANWPLPVLLLALQNLADPTLIGRPDDANDSSNADGNTSDDAASDDESDEDEDEDEDEAEENEGPQDPATLSRDVANRLRELSPATKCGSLGPELQD